MAERVSRMADRDSRHAAAYIDLAGHATASDGWPAGILAGHAPASDRWPAGIILAGHAAAFWTWGLRGPDASSSDARGGGDHHHGGSRWTRP